MFRISKLMLFALVISFILFSCKEQTPVSQEEHTEAAGFNIYSGGKLILKMYNLNLDTSISKGLNLPLSSSTSDFEVRFLNDLGNELSAYEEGQSLIVIVEDSTLVNTTIVAVDPATTDVWKFKANGIKAGNTLLTIRLDHHGHPDFTSPKFPLLVK
ncbi:MAG: hypothetical protein NTW25_14625 [Candidatus Kapabacteria bacterium]|nr:hypothetical protein [Candidatus Kapabacteria bacterium]